MRDDATDAYFVKIGKDPEYMASEEGAEKFGNVYEIMARKFRKYEAEGYDVMNYEIADGQFTLRRKAQ